ncbi:hypothetical protein PVA18_03445 [Ehrlichia muris subsp. eauclairensis]|uniref:hypothetical protein n=1 Tax=Ehrlichia TaxID=943 RepID=UPI000A36EC00|nr:hypothetical protein [Ehrlichia sp. Wisconsin_h]OUC04317.1 hypothetical protein DB91_03045 [Ehrlichia sp. Wisconsin_h]
MTHSSTIKISSLVSLLLIFIILLAFSLFKYLRQRQQVPATLPDDEQPPAIQGNVTSHDNIIPINNINLPQAELLELICGISNESSNAPIIRGITPDREFRNIPLLEINEITVVPASSLENYDKLSQIVANSIPDNSYQSLNNHEKTIMNIAKKHIESIKATLNIQDKECCRIFHNRITTAAILEHIFNKSQSLTPNISIIHELVNHYNPAGGQRCYMPLKFLKLVFKECQEIDTSKATTKDIVITFKRAKTTKSLACTINTNIIIPYKGKNEKLSCKLDFTITSSDSQNFSCVCYENISSILFIPSRMNIDITSPSSTNNSCIANADSARLTTHTLVKHGNYYCTQLTYSFPNLQAPLLIDIENIYPILDDVPPAIQTTSPSSAATPYDDIIPTNSNIKMPQAELLELMCGISNESLNAPIIRDITPDREFRNIPLLKINEIVVVPAPSLKNYGKLSQIVANSIPDNSYQSLNNHEKAIMNIAKNHIESIKATLNIQDKECCRIFHNRITTAAILEHIFNKSQSLIPNISIIHALVNHYNLEEGCCAMPLKFLKLVFKEHQEIDMSKATTKDIIITFKRAETTKSLACTSNTNIIIPYKGKNEKLLCKLDFTIISPDPQNFSEVHYKSIFFELHVPDRIKTHIPFPPPHASCSLTDLVRLIGCAPDVHVDNNHYTQFIYSFPNLKAPLLTSKQSFNAVCGFAGTSVENCSHATQQHC